MKTYWLETYGCQMNKAESGSLEASLKANGWQPAESDTEAQLVIINTCSVRKTAENRIWGRLGHFRSLKKKRSFQVALMGCMAERLKEEIRKYAPEIDFIVGTFQKLDFAKHITTSDNLSKAKQDFFDTKQFQFSGSHITENTFHAMVPIMHGCNNYCSYCIVPYVRGREISRPIDNILEEVQTLISQGLKEITFLGQNVNSYHYQSGTAVYKFPDLLAEITEQFDNDIWFRFVSSHPKDFLDELISVIAGDPRICNHIHLALQHGSNSILSQMNRKYTIEHYIERVQALRKAVPNASISTDLLVGFPGETDDDFRKTLEAVKTIRFNDAFTYKYNSREGTKAFDLGDTVPEPIKHERLQELIDTQREIGHNLRENELGKTVKVLVEGTSKKNENELLARTERNEMVVFPGPKDLIGTFTSIVLETLNGTTFTGKEKV
ncbi:MAG: tRNA (N6-isopentenyl adenosine(37)-C2)-methylthiotransferase MiaB [Spirochaetia bacterium]